jgi:hypothetical protein
VATRAFNSESAKTTYSKNDGTDLSYTIGGEFFFMQQSSIGLDYGLFQINSDADKLDLSTLTIGYSRHF